MSTPSTEMGPDRSGAPERQPGQAPVVAILATALGVLAVGVTGWRLSSTGTDLHLAGGNVLRGGYAVVLGPGVLLPVALGLVGVLWGPLLASRVRWDALLVGSAAATAAWAVALALSSGEGRLTEPLASRYEYPSDVPRVGSLGNLLATFTASVPADSADPWTTHVAGHPPGALLAFVLLDRLGMSGLGWAAALCIAGGAAAVPAVLVAVRAVAGEATARTVAPFAVLAPTALWVATSADALFAGVAAWGIALLATAAAGAPGRARDFSALGGGLLSGVALFLSFGLAALGLTALAVVLVQRRRLGRRGTAQVLGIAAVGVLVVVTAFALAGYWWLDGLAAAASRVRSGPSYADRPLTFFLFANLAAGALAAGPAAVAGLACVRGARLAAVPWAALAGMLASELTGLVRGETERIWLPFLVWLLPATAALPVRQRRAWLAASAVLALLIELTVRTEW